MSRRGAAAAACALAWGACSAAPSLDLAALLAEADTSSPAILAAKARVRAASAEIPRAGSPPDPVLALGVTNASLDRLTFGSSEMSNATVSWSQEVPWPGKLARAADVARAATRAAETSVEEARARVRAGVESAYVRILRIDRTSALLDDGRALLGIARQAARARYESGDGALADVLKAGAAASRLDAESVALHGERAATVAELAALLGRTSDEGLGGETVEPATTIPPVAVLEAAALERSPAIRASRAAADREAARLEAARRDEKPDLLWNAAYGWRNGLDPLIGGGVGIRLPVRRDARQRQEVARVEAEGEAARSEASAASAEVLGRVRAYAAHAAHTARHVRLLRESVLVQDRAAFDASLAAFAAGRAPFAGVLDDVRALVDDRKAAEEQQEDFLGNLVALEGLTGLELIAPAAPAPGVSR